PPPRGGRLGRLRHARATEMAVPLPELPWGYHRFTATAGDWKAECLVIRAPRTCASVPPGARWWAPFIPVYALRGNGPCGTLGDLREVARWARSLGAHAVGTLPLNAAFLDDPYDPSPYAPVSRRFWNELYLCIEEVPESRDDAVQAMLADPAWQAEARRLAAEELVDHRAVHRLRRPVLERMAEVLDRPGPRKQALEAWLALHPETVRYAAFRAATERHGIWRKWAPHVHAAVAAATPGSPPPAEVCDPRSVAYHVASQFWMEEQLAALKADAAAGGAGLALDLPVGVHNDGYDAWMDRDTFAAGASVGAPPDLMFRGGQDWGFPPPHPWLSRFTGYAALRAGLQAQMRHASLLRIDHATGLHRLYWVPHGRPAADGVYVHAAHEEAYAILALESRRAGCVLFGEDLGTVPPEVPEAMRRHGLLRMHVFTLEAEAGEEPVPSPGPDQAAYLDTHDTPPFAAFYAGEDIERRAADGQLDAQAAQRERARRDRIRQAWMRRWAPEAAAPPARAPPQDAAAGTTLPAVGGAGEALPSPAQSQGGADGEDVMAAAPAVLRGCLSHLAQGPSPLLVLNLEDLWLDPRPQNQPGTWIEKPNWRRKAAVAVRDLPGHPVSGLLAMVEDERQRGASAPPSARVPAPAAVERRAA
ncbi:MAG TPA: 4-alpha-glucanotransferase, partial [Candidatus Thermoplasmatota archaeon]|nr:4-alpha-glucanotransferase [Candidatus Thermoplasmatota archaeon]